MSAGLSIRAYARHRGCAHNAVRKALAAGRIAARPDGKIDPTVADRQWAANTRATITTRNANVSPARAVLEHYRARLAKLEYEERMGRLVPKYEVATATFNRFRRMRDAMLNLPDRLAPMLAAERDMEVIRSILVKEILAAIEDR